LRIAIAEIATRRRVEIAFDAIWRKPPTIFNPKLVDAVENATKSARLFAPPHHLRRRARRLQPRQCRAGSDDLRSLQGRRQPQ